MKAHRRFKDHRPSFTQLMRLDPHHDAARYGHSIFAARRRLPHLGAVLKSGEHSRKIGGRVTKGPWRGMPIYTLTLEERRTCPRDCSHWLTCYGNKMNWSERIAEGPALERQLALELAELSRRHSGGFVVRLHVLGDFYSERYVAFWARALDRHPELHCFGYTARDPVSDPIGVQLDTLSRRRWDRFAIRFSNRWLADRSAVTLWRPGRVPPQQGTICPAQTGQTECCGTCGLCWNSRRNIFFQVH